METRGRFQLGDTVQLACLCRNAAGAPTVPDRAPVAVVSADAGPVLVQRLPCQDRYAQAGRFSYPLLLGRAFAAGRYTVLYQWALSGVPFAAAESFEVVAGGHPDGPGLALHYFARPGSDFVLVQCDSGRVIRRRNPRLP